MERRFVISAGAGFIGSAVVRHLVGQVYGGERMGVPA